jgi:nucleoside-diphosphate-sugar epimerase
MAVNAERVMVTGAAGFIGGHLTRHLAGLGHEVLALDVSPHPASLRGKGISFHQVDLRDASRFAPLLQDVAVVYHLASVHLEVHADRAAFEETHVRAVDRLVSDCAEHGVRRLVHTSSVGIYGHVTHPPAREDSPRAPETPYEQTKLAGETAALRRASEVGLDIVVLRPAWVYGPGCRRTAKLLRAVRKGAFFYVGGGRNLRHPVFIQETLEAYVRAADAPRTSSGQAYIIAGPRSLTLREMIETCASALGVPSPRWNLPVSVARGLAWAVEAASKVVGREPLFSRRSLAFFLNDNAFETSAAARDLGFQARVDFDEGIRRTLADGNGGLAA